MKRVTLHEIAQETGVSEATVSRSLKGSYLIPAETRQRVLNCARDLGYKKHDCRDIALIIPRGIALENYYGVLLRFLQEELYRRNFVPVLFTAQDLNLLDRIPFAGAISLMDDNGLEKYWGCRSFMPLVCINTAPRHLHGVYSVCSDDTLGMHDLVEHLYQHGHRKIGRVGYDCAFNNPANWNSTFRNRIFSNLMSDYGLPHDLFAVENDQGISDALRTLLNEGISALILLHEGMELRVYRALRLMQVQLPQELSIVGWSTDAIAENLFPPLTNLNHNYPELARQACDLLDKLLKSEHVGGDIFIPYLFHERNSVTRLQA